MKPVKLAIVTIVSDGVLTYCPHCKRAIARTNSYYGSGKGSFRCNYCYCLYKVRFAGDTSDAK